VVLTIRDPRDAVVSMMDRFGMAFDPACAAVLSASRAVIESAAKPHLLFRYERRFFDDIASVASVAQFLGLSASPAEQRRIFESYTTERVRAFGQSLGELPPERIGVVGTLTTFDTLTHIHRRHIGDQQVGKWRDRFDGVDLARLAPILRALRYN